MTELINNPPVDFVQIEEKRISRKRPTGINSATKQHGVMILDTSGSMAGSKIRELNDSFKEFIRELSEKINKDGFFVSVVEFNSYAKQTHSGVPARELAKNTPRFTASGGTDFDAAITCGVEAINDFVKDRSIGYKYLKPVTVFLSDGHSMVSDVLLEDLKDRSTVVTVAYGDDADEETLKRIATSPEHSIKISDGRGQLRQFFAQIAKTVQHSLMVGTDAEIGLANDIHHVK